MEEQIYINSTDNIKLSTLISNTCKDKIVILCHGIRGNKHERGSFDMLAQEIQKNGYSTLRFDFRGHGQSTGIDYEMTIGKEIEDIESVINFSINKKYNKIIILGASFGASIVSLTNYSKFSQVKALILWYGAFDYNKLKNDRFLSDKNKEIALKDGFYPSYNKEGKLYRFGIPLFEEINKYKPQESIQKITLPKLFVHGLEDTTIPYELSIEMKNKCKNSKLELIENGSHTFDTNKPSLDNAINKTINFVKEIF